MSRIRNLKREKRISFNDTFSVSGVFTSITYESLSHLLEQHFDFKSERIVELIFRDRIIDIRWEEKDG